MIRQSILSVLNQTYKDFTYVVGIKIDTDTITHDFSPIYGDLLHDKRLIINVNKNNLYCFSHFNNIDTITSVPNYEDYDLFIKMDDDDIYKSKYVENIIKCFTENNDIDIVSSKISYQLNGSNLYKSETGYDNLGGNPNNSNYHMPMTFAFNKKAFDSIKNLTKSDVSGHDDMMWRVAWEKNGLKHINVNNEKEIIWNIHGGNASVGGFLKKEIELNRLTKLANLYNSDKGTVFQEQHGYTLEYDKYIPEKGNLTLLEIGILRGDSLKMWNDYNPELNIHGIDNDINVYNYISETEKIKIHIGDQSDINFLDSVAEKTGKLDFIIDDGSHHSVHIVSSFKGLYPYLNNGGYYFIEDLHAGHAHVNKTYKEIMEYLYMLQYTSENFTKQYSKIEFLFKRKLLVIQK
jgi:hypothetical protein